MACKITSTPPHPPPIHYNYAICAEDPCLSNRKSAQVTTMPTIALILASHEESLRASSDLLPEQRKGKPTISLGVEHIVHQKPISVLDIVVRRYFSATRSRHSADFLHLRPRSLPSRLSPSLPPISETVGHSSAAKFRHTRVDWDVSLQGKRDESRKVDYRASGFCSRGGSCACRRCCMARKDRQTQVLGVTWAHRVRRCRMCFAGLIREVDTSAE